MSPATAGAERRRHAPPPGYSIHGHAIISRDDMIADGNGMTPASLRNDADWTRFQAALDAACVTVLGRLGHELNPNPAPQRRRRLVISRRIRRLEKGEDAWWWNPAGCAFEEALRTVAPGGGIVAVPGGQAVFDLFLEIGYDAFHLARAEHVTLGDGLTLFSGLSPRFDAESALAEAGLSPDVSLLLDPQAGVSLTIWRRTSRNFCGTRTQGLRSSTRTGRVHDDRMDQTWRPL